MLIESYNCKKDMCNLAAIYEESGFRLKSLFKDISRFKKTKTEKEYKYDKVDRNIGNVIEKMELI